MEKWNLYDKHRNLLPDVHIRGQQIPYGMYHLVVHICVFNAEGKMLICQRTDDREVWPTYWDVSAAGSALLNETSAQAAQRETVEETGLLHDFNQEQIYFTIHGKDWFSDWYLIETDQKEFQIQKEEVQDYRWASLSEIQHMKKEGTFIPYHEGFLEMIYSIKKNRGAIS